MLLGKSYDIPLPRDLSHTELCTFKFIWIEFVWFPIWQYYILTKFYRVASIEDRSFSCLLLCNLKSTRLRSPIAFVPKVLSYDICLFHVWQHTTRIDKRLREIWLHGDREIIWTWDDTHDVWSHFMYDNTPEELMNGWEKSGWDSNVNNDLSHHWVYSRVGSIIWELVLIQHICYLSLDPWR